MGYDSARFVDEVDAELICSICHGILEDPKQVCILKDINNTQYFMFSMCKSYTKS